MTRPLCALLLAWVTTGLAEAQSGPVRPAPPDWTGYYTLARGQDLAGYTPVNLDLHPVIVAHLQPWARMKMEATDGIAEDTGQLCQPTGIFRNPPFAGEFLWLPGPDKIVIIYRATNTAGIQRIYLNRAHPRNLRPSWNGDSIGRWEGETLEVETIGFTDRSWLQPTMEPHTEEARLLQRIRRVGKNNDLIEIQYTVEDWKALTSAYTYTRYYKKRGDAMEEEVCNEDPDLWRPFKDKRLKPLIERSKVVR